LRRRQIDGLRAVAVAPVILWRAGVEAVSGGFIGVDVFSVICGDLIAGLILSEREACIPRRCGCRRREADDGASHPRPPELKQRPNSPS
jgi:hypothetical protein